MSRLFPSLCHHLNRLRRGWGPLCGQRRSRHLLLLLSLLLLLPPWQQASQASTSPRVEQYQVKAVFLYNFLNFVTWPANHKIPGYGDAMVIGVIGDSPVQQALTELSGKVEGKGTPPLQVVYFGGYQEGLNLSACHILFVSASEKNNVKEIVSSLNKAPVLTVADTEAFLPAGGMITLLEQQNRIRYHINRKAASEAGLRLSSQLLKTAIDVQDE